MKNISSSKSVIAASAVTLGLTGCWDEGKTFAVDQYKSNDFNLSLEKKGSQSLAAQTQKTAINLLDTSSYVLVAQGAKESIVDTKENVVPGVQCKAVIKSTGKKIAALNKDDCAWAIPSGTEAEISVIVTAPNGYQNEFSPKPINIDVKAPELTIANPSQISIGGYAFTYALQSPEPLDIARCTITFQDGSLPAITLDPSEYQITTAGNNSYNIVVPSAPGVLEVDNHLVDYTTRCPDSSGNMGSIKFSVPSF